MLPTSYLFVNHIYEQDLALNNLQWLICHKTYLTNQLFLLITNCCIYFMLYFTFQRVDCNGIVHEPFVLISASLHLLLINCMNLLTTHCSWMKPFERLYCLISTLNKLLFFFSFSDTDQCIPNPWPRSGRHYPDHIWRISFLSVQPQVLKFNNFILTTPGLSVSPSLSLSPIPFFPLILFTDLSYFSSFFPLITFFLMNPFTSFFFAFISKKCGQDWCSPRQHQIHLLSVMSIWSGHNLFFSFICQVRKKIYCSQIEIQSILPDISINDAPPPQLLWTVEQRRRKGGNFHCGWVDKWDFFFSKFFTQIIKKDYYLREKKWKLNFKKFFVIFVVNSHI